MFKGFARFAVQKNWNGFWAETPETNTNALSVIIRESRSKETMNLLKVLKKS